MFRKITNILSLVALIAVIAVAIFFVFIAGNGGSESPLDTNQPSNSTTRPPVTQDTTTQTPDTPERTPEPPPSPWQWTSLSEIFNTEYLMLVNRDFAIPRDVQSEMVQTYPRVRSRGDSRLLHESALSALEDMFASASAAGFANLMLFSGFRTIAAQTNNYNNAPAGFSMPPWHSEHHTGLAVDIAFVGNTTLSSAFGNTSAGRWLRENSWRYGFILRYPENTMHITSIDYEPWHFRFIGVPHAYFIHTNEIVLEEYIDLLHERESLRVNIDGTIYYIYWQMPVDGQLNLPTDREFIVSSDNTGGYIITAW